MADDRSGEPVLLAAIAAASLLVASFAGPSLKPAAQASRNALSRSRVKADSDDKDTGERVPGLWPIVKRVANGFMGDRLMTEAAGVTFYALLALFPAIATLVSLYGLFADPVTVGEQLKTMSGLIPGGGLDIIEAQVKALTENGKSALGWGVVIGFFTSLWSANQGIKSLFDALNVVFHRRESRSYIRLTLTCLGLTLSCILFIVVAMIGVVAVPVVLNFVGAGSWTDTLLRLARWPVLLVMLGLFLGVIYTYGPDRKRPVWRWVSWGSAFSSIFWVLASAGFSYYVANFGSYNKTYGALGAVIGFMTWIWISMMIVLLGAELNADLEQMEPDPPKGKLLPG